MLWLKGYRLRHRRWRLPRGGELDLVMEQRGEIVFVEVKTRSSDELGGALGAVDRAKRDTLVRVAGAYLGRHGLWQRPHRFDIVAIERRGGPMSWRMCHYRDVIRDDRGRLM